MQQELLECETSTQSNHNRNQAQRQWEGMTDLTDDQELLNMPAEEVISATHLMDLLGEKDDKTYQAYENMGKDGKMSAISKGGETALETLKGKKGLVLSGGFGKEGGKGMGKFGTGKDGGKGVGKFGDDNFGKHGKSNSVGKFGDDYDYGKGGDANGHGHGMGAMGTLKAMTGGADPFMKGGKQARMHYKNLS